MPISITITSDNPYGDVLTYDEAYNTITGIRLGTAVITATGTHPETNEIVTTSVSIVVGDSTGLIDGTDYYIMNYNTERVLSLSSASDANNVNIDSNPRGVLAQSQWTVIKNTDGTTRLQSVYSSSGRSAYVSGTNLLLYNATSARTKLNIYRVREGRFQGLYLIMYNNQFLRMNSSGDVYLSSVQGAGSYWSFMAVQKGYADIYSFNYDFSKNGEQIPFNTTANNTNFYYTLHRLGYSAFMSENETAAYAFRYLLEDHVFVFHGHGTPGAILYTTTNNVITGAITASSSIIDEDITSDQHSIMNCDPNELATLRCVLYIGCETGVDITPYRTTYNLVDQTFEKGAHFVLGTTEKLRVSDGVEWLELFLSGLDSGLSITDACSHATENTGTVWIPYDKDDNSTGYFELEEFPIYIKGDGSQYLQ